jgi:2-dehydro-3-deoxygluconokinase
LILQVLFRTRPLVCGYILADRRASAAAEAKHRAKRASAGLYLHAADCGGRITAVGVRRPSRWCSIVDMSTAFTKDDRRWTDVRCIAALGEPLIELQPTGDGNLQVAFGGDVANTMVCLARILRAASCHLSIVTALGNSAYSAWLRNKLVQEGIGVVEPPNAGEPGIYGISPDSGHQSPSSYWRAQSAARQFLHSANLRDFEELLGKPQILMITGITLALCSAASFENLCDWIELHRDQCRLVFDTNFRPALWANAGEARERIGTLERLASIIATGLEDEKILWQAADADEVIERISELSGEFVVRGGKEGCWVGVKGHWDHVTAAPAKVIDSVGAGDAHLAGYVAARITGCTQLDAAQIANRVAAVIVSQRGSVPKKDAALPRLGALAADESAAST